MFTYHFLYTDKHEGHSGNPSSGREPGLCSCPGARRLQGRAGESRGGELQGQKKGKVSFTHFY